MSYPAVARLVGGFGPAPGSGSARMLRHGRRATGSAGVPIEVVSRLLTHGLATTNQTYVHLDAADIREALRRAGAWQEEGT